MLFTIMKITLPGTLALATLVSFAALAAAQQAAKPKPEETEIWTPVPAIVTPGATNLAPPSDAIVLFDGSNEDQWVSAQDHTPAKWDVHDGILTVSKGTGNIETKHRFKDYQLHIEWRIPENITGSGQARGNSGVFLASTGVGDDGYELQVLDSYNNTTYVNGQAASIYKQSAPLVNPNRKPGEWQTYDIVFMVPQFDLQGRLVEPAYATVFHNGVLVQNHFKLAGNTPFNQPPSYVPHPAKLPLELQYHRNPVRFRNIWIREIKEIDGTRVAEPMIERAPDKPAAPKPPDHKGPSPAR